MPALQLDKKDLYPVLLILCAAILIRVAYFMDFARTAVYYILPYSDSAFYLDWARDIASGDILGGARVFMKWPLYGYVLAALIRVLGENISLVYALQSVMGALTAVLIFVSARTLFNRTAGFIAALFYLFYGMPLYYEGALIYTALSLFLNILLFLYFIHIERKPTSGLFWAGVFSGICALTQANILVFAPAAAVWIARGRSISFSGRVRAMVVFILGLSIPLGMAASRNYFVEKDKVLMTGHLGINFYLGNNPQATGLFYNPEHIAPDQQGMSRDARIIAEQKAGRRLRTSEVSDYWLRESFTFIKNEPAAFFRLILRKIAYLFMPSEPNHDTEYYLSVGRIRVAKFLAPDLRFIMPFFLLGAFLGLRQFKKNALLYLMLVSLSLSVIIFFVATRFRILLVPYMAMFAGLAVFSIWQAAVEKRYAWTLMLCACVFIFHAVLSNARGLRPGLNDYARYRGHIQTALLYEAVPDRARALTQFEEAARINPDGRLLLLTRGSFYYDNREPDRAEADFKKAMRLYPLFADAYYNLGLAYNGQQRFAEARGVLKELVRLDPEDAAAHFELGRAYKNLGEPELAAAEFRAARRLLAPWRKADMDLIDKEAAGLK